MSKQILSYTHPNGITYTKEIEAESSDTQPMIDFINEINKQIPPEPFFEKNFENLMGGNYKIHLRRRLFRRLLRLFCCRNIFI